jgi:hypothetical protein
MANVFFGGVANSTSRVGTDVLICPGGAKPRYLAIGKKRQILPPVLSKKKHLISSIFLTLVLPNQRFKVGLRKQLLTSEGV